eukprot:UN10109
MSDSKPNTLSTIDYLLEFIEMFDEFDGLNIVEYQPNLIVIKNALTAEEQCVVFESVAENKLSKSQKSMKNTNNRFRYGHFMRLNLSQTRKYTQTYPMFDKIFKKIIQIIQKHNKIKFANLSKDEIHKLKQK